MPADDIEDHDHADRYNHVSQQRIDCVAAAWLECQPLQHRDLHQAWQVLRCDGRDAGDHDRQQQIGKRHGDDRFLAIDHGRLGPQGYLVEDAKRRNDTRPYAPGSDRADEEQAGIEQTRRLLIDRIQVEWLALDGRRFGLGQLTTFRLARLPLLDRHLPRDLALRERQPPGDDEVDHDDGEDEPEGIDKTAGERRRGVEVANERRQGQQ